MVDPYELLFTFISFFGNLVLKNITYSVNYLVKCYMINSLLLDVRPETTVHVNVFSMSN